MPCRFRATIIFDKSSNLGALSEVPLWGGVTVAPPIVAVSVLLGKE